MTSLSNPARGKEKIALVAALVASLLGPSLALHADDRLGELENQWKSQKYQEVLPKLLEHRETPHGRNAFVDYMIATSACRLTQMRELGARFFVWMLRHYNLEPGNRSAVETEAAQCRADVAPRQVVFVAQRIGVGSAGVSGKMFHWLRTDEIMPIGISPVTVVREVPLAELTARRFPVEQREQAVEAARLLGGSGARVASVGRFVVVSTADHSAGELEQIGNRLQQALTFYETTFGARRPDALLTAHLVPSIGAMRRLAERIHGLRIPDASIGYSYREDLSVIGVIPRMTIGTLMHELFHLLIRDNFGDIPPWLDEGTAALYEVSDFTEAGILGRPNWRGPILRELWGERPGIEELVRMDWRTFDQQQEHSDEMSIRAQAVNHATARYFMLYLQEHGLLRPVFDAFRDRDPGKIAGDPADDAVQQLTRVLGRPLGEVDADFDRWFQRIEPRPLHRIEIMQAQHMLTKLGYEPGPVDGIVGTRTRQAIRAFQRDRNLTQSGELDAATLQALGGE